MGTKKNKFSPFLDPWNQEKWDSYIPENQYRVITPRELPSWYPKDLASKAKLAVTYCSSSTATLYYGINILRKDKTSLDEEPYVSVFNKKTRACYSGFLHHGDYQGRTRKIPKQMEQMVTASGFDLSYGFKGLPTEPSGSIEDLEKERLLEGFHAASKVAEEEGFEERS